MMINAEEEKQLLDQLGVVGSAQGTHYQQTVEFGMHTHTHTHTNLTNHQQSLYMIVVLFLCLILSFIIS